MKLDNKQFKINENMLNYYEVKSDKEKPILIMIHGEGTDSSTYRKSIMKLGKHYHIYLIDLYGHGGSSKDKELYVLDKITEDTLEFINHELKDKMFTILGTDVGGVVAANIASKSEKCEKLILENAPFFFCFGENKQNWYHYKDLYTVCSDFLNQKEEDDFVYYYFMNQLWWNELPEESRESTKERLCEYAKHNRMRHHAEDLQVTFMADKFLMKFQGMNNFDPEFGVSLYDNSFYGDMNITGMLYNIICPVVYFKGITTLMDGGLIKGSTTDADLDRVNNLIKNFRIIEFECEHPHSEKTKMFVKEIIE